MALGWVLKPVLVDIQLFDPAHTGSIRLARETALREGLIAREKKPTKRSTTKKKKKLTLDPKATAALGGMDEATKAFLLKAMGQ